MPSELIEQIKRTARKYGMVYPVLVDQRDRLIDGRHRVAVWRKWPRRRVKIETPYDLFVIRTIGNSVRRTVSEEERREEIQEMGGFLEKDGLRFKREQAERIAQDTGLSERYVYNLLTEREKIPHEVQSKPPLTEAKRAKGGRPTSWLTVCPSCGYKSKRTEFGRIRA